MKHGLGKIIGVICVMLFVLPHVVNAMEVKYTAEFSEADLIFRTLRGYDVVQIKDGDWINDIGKPMIPTREIKIALPSGMAAKRIRIDDTQSMVIKGEYNIFPAQPPIRISGKPGEFVQPDLDIYNSMHPYPSELVELIDQTDLAGQGMAVIQINPVQYIPREKKLTLNMRISFVIEGVDGYKCGDYLPANISESGRKKYEQMIKEMVVNPEDVQLNTDPGGWIGSRALPSGGPYKHVIISRSSDVSYWQVLADWRTKCGLKSIVVTTTYIYNIYPGADHQEEIRNFIIDARNTWGTMYFLLCGEDSDLPFEYRKYYAYEGDKGMDSIPSDQYYGDYDDDWDYEVYVGRSTARASTEIACFIDKVLKYEKDPPLTNYILDVTLLGMDLTLADEWHDLTRGEDLKERIDWLYIPSRFTVTEVYDTDNTENHRTKFLNALNDGQGLVNHNDHAKADSMGTGDSNHGWYIDRGDVGALTNNNRMSVIYSLGCNCLAMDYYGGDCIAEHFVIYNSLKAGVAFTGNTRSGWFYEGNPYSLSCQLDEYWWRGLFNYNKYILGEALAYTKGNCPYSDDYWRYCQWTLNLLGEPAMPIWTNTPESFIVTHPVELPIGPSGFTVHVTSPSVPDSIKGGPVNQSYVCLWKGSEVYLTGYTNILGDVGFTPSPTTTGDMYVTVTKHNYLPYEGTATVDTIPLQFIVRGDCYYQDMSPVIPVFVEIYNLNAGIRWNADIVSNHYNLTLARGTDVHLNDTLRIIGKDSVEWVNVTDHTVTEPEISAGEVTIHLTLDEHYRDLNDFPMRLAWSPYDEYSGAAVAQMTLDYMWWDGTGSPPIKYTQSELYTYGLDYSEADPYFDLVGMWHTIQDKKPMPYSQYGYNFTKRHNTDQSTMLKEICMWIDYTIGTYGEHEDGHPYHVPAAVPTFGHYGNWMAVRGIHTDQVAYPMPPSLTVYGFWVNDPVTGGIGENSYKNISTWNSTYYLAMTVGDYTGEYLGIFEPPESAENCALTIAQSKTRFTSSQINQLENMGDRTVITKPIEDWIIRAAIDGVTEELIPYDENFATIFNTAIPGKPFFVEGVSNEDYYAVPFTMFISSDKIEIKNRGKTLADLDVGMSTEAVNVVILISANDGSFKEASWTKEAVKYLPLSKKEARQIAFEAAEDYGLEVGDINGLKPELIHRKASPYYPEWRVIIGEYAIYISQNGVVTIEEWIESEPGGGVMSDDGSFAYALNTAMPTPFLKSTKISYSIAKSGHVSLNVYDISGRLVKTLINANKDAGIYSQEWNGYSDNNQKLAPGVYFAKLASGDFVSVKKLILIK